MKKRFSALTVGIIAFLMLATGVAAGSFTRWAGEGNFDNSMSTMDKVQIGIDLLKGDLDEEEQAHQSTQDELDKLKKKITEATDKEEGTITDLINEKNTLKSDLSTMTADRDKLQGNLNLIATKTSIHVVELNKKDGADTKYDYLVKHINPMLEDLYTMGNLSAASILEEDPGIGPTDNQLQEAIKDMKEIEGKSGETLNKFDDNMKVRIEQKLNQETGSTPGDDGE